MNYKKFLHVLEVEETPTLVEPGTRHKIVAPASRRSRVRRKSSPIDNRKGLLIGTVAAVALAAVAILYFSGIIFKFKTDQGTLIVELENLTAAEVFIDGDKVKFDLSKDGKTLSVKIDAGKRKISVRSPDGIELTTNLGSELVIISAGKEKQITARLEPLPARGGRQPTDASVPDRKVAEWKPTSEQRAFYDRVAKLPAAQQVQAVRKKLQEINPGFDGKVQHRIENNSVIEFSFITDEITDIWPVRTLADLETLRCPGSGPKQGQLSDLSPLEGLPLTQLECSPTPIAHLTPLKGMLLEELTCSDDIVFKNSPVLKEMKTLKTINGQPAAEFWKTLENR